MNIFEITVRKFVSPFRVLREPIVDAQMPFGISRESVQTNKFVLFICRGPVPGPSAFVVGNKASFFDKLRGEREGIFVQLDARRRLSGDGADRKNENYDYDRLNKGIASNRRLH